MDNTGSFKCYIHSQLFQTFLPVGADGLQQHLPLAFMTLLSSGGQFVFMECGQTH